MEEILKQISEGFLREKSLSSEQVKERISDLNQYLKLLDSVVVKISEVSVSHRKDVANVLNEKTEHENALAAIKVAHSNELKSHAEKVESKQTHSSNLDSDIKAKESRAKELDMRVEDLNGELRNSQESSDSLRLQVSVLERNVRDLQNRESLLSKSITKLSEEESALSNSIEAKKKEVGRLSSDLATLEARTK